MSTTPDQVARFAKSFEGLDPGLRPVAVSLRDLVRDAAPDAQETVKWGFPTWVAQGNICSISPGSDYLRLQLFRGAELSDPDRILEGSGKGMRQVKVGDTQTMPSKAIAALVHEAVRLDTKG